MSKNKISSKIKTIRLSCVRKSRFHWNRDISPADIEELADSIGKFGQMHPLIVQRSKNSDHIYELLAGERRYQAMRKLNLATVQVKIADVDDIDARLISLEENLKIKKPSSDEWHTALVEWRRLTNEKRGFDAYARPPKGRPKGSGAKSADDTDNDAQEDENATADAIDSEQRPVSAEEMAETFGVSRRTIERNLKREENLIKPVICAYRARKITGEQADNLANLSEEEQAEELGILMSENQDKQYAEREERREQKRFEELRKQGLTSARRLLSTSQGVCSKDLLPKLHDLLRLMNEDESVLSRVKPKHYVSLSETHELLGKCIAKLEERQDNAQE